MIAEDRITALRIRPVYRESGFLCIGQILVPDGQKPAPYTDFATLARPQLATTFEEIKALNNILNELQDCWL